MGESPGRVIGIAHDGYGVLLTQGIFKAAWTETAGTQLNDRVVERHPRKWRSGYIISRLVKRCKNDDDVYCRCFDLRVRRADLQPEFWRQCLENPLARH